MKRIKLFTYQGKKILKGDYTNLSPQEIIETFRQVNKKVIHSNEKFYMLADFTGIQLDVRIIHFLQNDESKSAAKNFIKTAAVGLTGIAQLGLKVYNSATRAGARAFKSEEEAIAWFLEG